MQVITDSLNRSFVDTCTGRVCSRECCASPEPRVCSMRRMTGLLACNDWPRGDTAFRSGKSKVIYLVRCLLSHTACLMLLEKTGYESK